MKPFPDETLTILVLISIILTGVTFIAVSVVIICLLCIKYRQKNTVNPDDTHSIASSISSDNDSISIAPSSTSVSPIPIPTKTPVIRSNKRNEEQQSQLERSRSDLNSIIYERSNNNQKKRPQRSKHDATTMTNESQLDIPYYSQRQQQRPFKLITDARFIDRHTPYPPDVIARDRYMMTHLQFPRNNTNN